MGCSFATTQATLLMPAATVLVSLARNAGVSQAQPEGYRTGVVHVWCVHGLCEPGAGVTGEEAADGRRSA